MELNKKCYGMIKIYNSKDDENDLKKELNTSVKNQTTHKVFEALGEFNVKKLGDYLGNKKWTEIYPLTEKNDVVASVEEGKVIKKEEDFRKLLIYKGPPGTAVLELNCKENYHQLYIFLNSYLKDSLDKETKSDLEIIEETRQIFDNGFDKDSKIKWNPKDETSNLVKKLESN